jgi:hypothetical protein
MLGRRGVSKPEWIGYEVHKAAAEEYPEVMARLERQCPRRDSGKG